MSLTPTVTFSQQSKPAAAARAPVPGAPAGVTAFVNVAVVPMDAERVLTDQTVVVKDGWIAAVGPSTKIKVPAGAARIDGRGHYLLPGLADCHAHLMEDSESIILIRYLVHGVTTIRNMDHQTSGEQAERVLRWRARAAAGELLSPHIYTAASWYAYGGPLLDPNKIPLGEVAQRIAAYKAAGYDFVKPYFENRTIFDSVAAAARRMGLPLAGHVPSAVPLPVALASMKSIEHQTGTTSESLGGMGVPLDGLSLEAPAAEIGAMAGAFRRAGTWMCPTANILDGIMRVNAPDDPKMGRRVQQSYQLLKALQDSGAGLLLGSDQHWAAGASIHKELEVLVREVGLSPYQALAAGTRSVAQYFGTLDSTGTVAVGKRADLVLLAGNPLQDVRHTREPAGVMLGGRWLDRVALDRQLAISPSPQRTALDWLFLDVFRLRGLDKARRSAWGTHRKQLNALADSLARAAAASAPAGDGERQRLARRLAEELGALRALLTPKPGERVYFDPAAPRDLFDPAARVWLREQARQGVRVTIPGVVAVP
jgi:imidazolonepropionase-like amidohydrolase